MTIICGFYDAESGTAYLAADTRTTAGEFIYPVPAKKIYECGPWHITYAGDALTGQILKLNARSLALAETIYDVAGALRDLLAGAGYKPDGDTGPVYFSERFIVARGGVGVWKISGAGWVEEQPGFCANGSGAAYAYGAAYVLVPQGVEIREVLTCAISAAMAFDTGCGGSPDIYEIPPPGGVAEDPHLEDFARQLNWKEKRGLT